MCTFEHCNEYDYVPSVIPVADLGGVRGCKCTPLSHLYTIFRLLCGMCYPALTTAFGGFVGYAHYLEPPFQIYRSATEYSTVSIYTSGKIISLK